MAALEDFLHRFPSHELAGTAILEIAQSQLSLGHQDEAAATLQRFLQDPRWKDCKELPQARQWLGQIYFGQEKYAEALAVWREYLTRYTAQEGWSAVEQCGHRYRVSHGREENSRTATTRRPPGC